MHSSTGSGHAVVSAHSSSRCITGTVGQHRLTSVHRFFAHITGFLGKTLCQGFLEKPWAFPKNGFFGSFRKIPKNTEFLEKLWFFVFPKTPCILARGYRKLGFSQAAANAAASTVPVPQHGLLCYAQSGCVFRKNTAGFF